MDSPQKINGLLEQYLKMGYHVPGATVYAEIAPFMKPAVRTVSINPDIRAGEVFAVSGGKLAFCRPAIQKFIDAGRIELSIPQDPVVDKGKDVHRIRVSVVGERYDLDGAPKRLEDVKVIDLVAREEEARNQYEAKTKKDPELKNKSEQEKREYIEGAVRKLMIEKQKFAVEAAITGAQARVVQKLLGIKPAYSAAELKHPFVILSVIPLVDMEDPDIKRMVTARMLGIRDVMYPGTQRPHLPAPVHATAEPHVELSCEPAPRPLGCDDGGFNDLPRSQRITILRQIIADAEMSVRLPGLPDTELSRLFAEFRTAQAA